MGSGIALRVVVVVVLDLGYGYSGRIQARLFSIIKGFQCFLMDGTNIMRTGYGSWGLMGPHFNHIYCFMKIGWVFEEYPISTIYFFIFYV